MSETENSSGPPSRQAVDKRVIKRVGGRHLVYRVKEGAWRWLPRPYALISNIEGLILVFYGAGQIWVTHRKRHRINEWIVRVPRFASKRMVQIVQELETPISEFIEQVNDLDLIGTLILERRAIEFHWTVPRDKLGDRQPDVDREQVINASFNQLATAFAQLQLAGEEGAHDVRQDQIELHQTS